LGYATCLLLMGALLVGRLYNGRYLTLGDLFRRRYGPAVERLGVLVLVPSSLIWAAAQVRALGQVLAMTISVHVTTAIYVSTIIVIAYTYLGGLLGDILTDFVQAILIALSLLVMVVVAVYQSGGVSATWASIAPQRLSLFVPTESIWTQLDRWAVPIFGSLVAQELIARVFSARSLRTAQRASYWSASIYLFFGLCPVLLGLMGPSLLPGLAEPEQLLPLLSRQLLPGWLQAVFGCALVAAILSTVDSILLASAALVAHNVLIPSFGIANERQKLNLARWCVLVFGTLSLIVALHASGIYELVEAASAFGTAGVLVVTLMALYVPWGGPAAAAVALFVGLFATPLFEHVLLARAPFLCSIASSLLAYCLVTVGTARRGQPEAARVQGGT
jgi:Na+/proline symporter